MGGGGGVNFEECEHIFFILFNRVIFVYNFSPFPLPHEIECSVPYLTNVVQPEKFSLMTKVKERESIFSWEFQVCNPRTYNRGGGLIIGIRSCLKH